MNVTVEAQNVEMSPSWKAQVEERLRALSDPRDPIISARAICSFKPKEKPPAEVSLVVTVRGKNIVVSKKGEHIEGALKRSLDTLKREVRQFYDLRSTYRTGQMPSREVIVPPEETGLEDLEGAVEEELEH